MVIFTQKKRVMNMMVNMKKRNVHVLLCRLVEMVVNLKSIILLIFIVICFGLFGCVSSDGEYSDNYYSYDFVIDDNETLETVDMPEDNINYYDIENSDTMIEFEYDNEYEDYLIEVNRFWETWQETYAELLRAYAKLHLEGQEAGWHFSLYDINQDGIPELFLAMYYYTGHMTYHRVYTFVENTYISIGFEGASPISVLTMVEDIGPYIFVYSSLARSTILERLYKDKNQIRRDYRGLFRVSDYDYADPSFWYLNIREKEFDWFELYINSNPESEFHLYLIPVTVEEFEHIFGLRTNHVQIDIFPISEYFIQLLLFEEFP